MNIFIHIHTYLENVVVAVIYGCFCKTRIWKIAIDRQREALNNKVRKTRQLELFCLRPDRLRGNMTVACQCAVEDGGSI